LLSFNNCKRDAGGTAGRWFLRPKRKSPMALPFLRSIREVEKKNAVDYQAEQTFGRIGFDIGR
jgi:hypothetical protein